MQEFKKRLVEFARAQYNMGQTRFEEKCGIHPGTISAIKSNGPTASVITKIAIACPELNLNWLFRGTGEMTVGEKQNEAETEFRTSLNEIPEKTELIMAYLHSALKVALKEACNEILTTKQ